MLIGNYRPAPMHKVFITYHHENDQRYKERLLDLNYEHNIFIDRSVDTGDIPDNLNDESIRRIIRDKYLRDSTVTILLVGSETKHRKHVDWELYSSMMDGSVNKKSGIVVIALPSINTTCYNAPHGDEEKQHVYPEISGWESVTTRSEYERCYPDMPARIIDNLLAHNALISVVPWHKAYEPDKLKLLIDFAFRDRGKCKYDLRRPMRRRNT